MSGAPEICFSGCFVTGGTAHVILIDRVSGRSSGWIKIGDSFQGYRVSHLGSNGEQLHLVREGSTVSLRLEGSPNARSGLTVTIKGREYRLYSDSQEIDGDMIILQGNVTGVLKGASFSCDTLRFNSSRERMELIGNVKIQRADSLLHALRMVIDQ